MTYEQWREPICVMFNQGELGTISGPFDALICLIDRWPVMSGLRFVKARSACRAALAGRGSAEVARLEFLAAVKEAGLMIRT